MPFKTCVEQFGNGKLIWLKSDALRVGLATFGAAVQSVQVYHPEQKKWIEVNCGFPKNPEEAEADTDYMGVTAGRCAGRIGGAHFTLDGKKYKTDANMPSGDTCHSGVNAYNKKQWTYTVVETPKSIGVRFCYVSPHMENGFPAELENTVYYHIEHARPNALHMDFDAHITETSPADATVVSIFNHCYWNLNGVPERTTDEKWEQPVPVHNHWVRVPASKVAEGDRIAIPTGRFVDISGTSLDFRKGRVLRDGMADLALLDRDPCGYDHPLALDGWKKGQMMYNGEAVSPITKIKMEVHSTYPSMWVYTANNKKLPSSGKPGDRYERWSGLGLEPQYYPDTPNRPEFPTAVIRRGKSTFSEKMLNIFTVESEAKL